MTDNDWSNWASAVGLGKFFAGVGILLYGLNVFLDLFKKLILFNGEMKYETIS